MAATKGVAVGIIALIPGQWLLRIGLVICMLLIHDTTCPTMDILPSHKPILTAAQETQMEEQEPEVQGQ